MKHLKPVRDAPKFHVDLVGGPLELHDRRILPFGEKDPFHVNKPENPDE